AAGIPFASAADRDATLRSLLALDVEATTHHTQVIAGCGLAPGLTDVLARHAVGALDAVDELHVARWGVAGSESVAEARRAQREEAREWRRRARPREAPRCRAHLVSRSGRRARMRARRHRSRAARRRQLGRGTGDCSPGGAGRAALHAPRPARSRRGVGCRAG